MNDSYNAARIAMGAVLIGFARHINDVSITSAVSRYDATMCAWRSSDAIYSNRYLIDKHVDEIALAQGAAKADIQILRTLFLPHDISQVLDSLMRNLDTTYRHLLKMRMPVALDDETSDGNASLDAQYNDLSDVCYTVDTQQFLSAAFAQDAFTDLLLLAIDALIATLRSNQDPCIVAICAAAEAVYAAQSACNEIITIHTTYMHTAAHQLGPHASMRTALQANELRVTAHRASVQHIVDAFANVCPTAQRAAYHAYHELCAIASYVESRSP